MFARLRYESICEPMNILKGLSFYKTVIRGLLHCERFVKTGANVKYLSDVLQCYIPAKCIILLFVTSIR